MEYLKIKDNIDLKELEKFGFELQAISILGEPIQFYVYEEMLVNTKTREITAFKMRMPAVIKLFDITQAGLVEKVENEKLPC